MRYNDRYKTISVHMTPEEWEIFNSEYEKTCDDIQCDISKHKFIKMLIQRSYQTPFISRLPG